MVFLLVEIWTVSIYYANISKSIWLAVSATLQNQNYQSVTKIMEQQSAKKEEEGKKKKKEKNGSYKPGFF